MSSVGDSSCSAVASSSSDQSDLAVAGAGIIITDGTDMNNHSNNLEPTDNEVDDELKELLDSALQDFDTQPGCGYGASVLGANEEEQEEVSVGGLGSAASNSSRNHPQSPPSASTNPYFPPPFSGFPSTQEGDDSAGRDLAEQLDEAMRSFIGDDPELMQNIEILAKAAESAGDSPEAQKEFADTLAKTLSSLAQNAEGLQEHLNEEDLNQAFSNLGLNPENVGVGLDGSTGGGGGADNPDILPVMQNMMKTLLSKEVLYPSLKEISQKYPKWLEENEGKTDKELIENYTLQYNLMKTICQEFEKETLADSEDTKNHRFKRILELMQEMQELGQPPKEILGEMAPGLEFDANGFPKLLNSNDQCTIM